jgi:hypothetical protein
VKIRKREGEREGGNKRPMLVREEWTERVSVSRNNREREIC